MCKSLLLKKIKILFLCTGNSCRSQMAEGLCKHLKSETIEAYSAGIEKHGLNPYAVEVMKELDIDISAHKSKIVSELCNNNFDYVITVCGHADENCPVFIGNAKKIHVGFDDPPKLADKFSNNDLKLNCYRKVREQIKKFIIELPNNLIV